jgi:acyl dehydratase
MTQEELQQASAELSYDASVVGVEVETGMMEVSREDILAYCDATGETNPLFTDEEAAKKGPHHGLIAPPTFCTSIRTGQGLDPKLVYGNATFHAGQRLEFIAPIRPGDVIKARTKVHEIYEKTGRTGLMVFLVRRTTYSNQLEQDVAISDQSMVYRQV